MFTSLPKSYAEDLTLNVTVFEDKVCQEMIKVKWVCKVGSDL